MVGKITEECFMAAGFSSGEYQNVLTTYKQLDLILKDPSITGVNFTGSTKAGASIAETAGKYVKKCVL
jgi:succinate-semialdehyde dehydrogenase / glutarate-semialdehyde dehydrogenase